MWWAAPATYDTASHGSIVAAMNITFTWAIVALGVLTAALGFKAVTIEIRESMDDFIADMQRQGQWVRWAAIAALLTAAASAVKEALF